MPNDFLSPNVVTKLFRDIAPSDYEKRANQIKEQAKTMQGLIPVQALQRKLNSWLGLIYWEGKQYDLAIDHFKVVLDCIKVEDDAVQYTNTLKMISRCYRLLKDYENSLKWVSLALDQVREADSAFFKLSVLTDYSDLLFESNLPFDKAYFPIVKTVFEAMEFSDISLDNPQEAIQKMSALNRKWNRKYYNIFVNTKDDSAKAIEELNEFVKVCYVGYYKKQASEKIIELNSEGK